MKYSVLAHYGNLAKDIECNDIQEVVDALKQVQGSSIEINHGRESSIVMLTEISLLKNHKFVIIKEELEKNGYALSDIINNVL